jgi:hypothetical protein
VGRLEDKRVIYIKGIAYERTEDDQKYWFQDVSDRKNKVHFTITKDKERAKKAEEGLRMFWTEVFS